MIPDTPQKPPVTDETLIARFQQGDLYAFDLIVKRYKNQLLNFAYRFLGDRTEAEDVVQEAFLRIFRKKHAYRNIARFSTWIYTITGNLAKTELRRKKKRQFFSLSNMGFDDREYDLPDQSKTPEETTDSHIREELVQKAIDTLPAKFREVIILRDLQELSYDEISEIAGIPIGTVKSRVNRGRLKLQDKLAPYFRSTEK
jgi:RNA polymerase sigma-70 factor, ECF subfamily